MRKQGSLLVVLFAACVALFAACVPAPVPVTTTTTSTTTTSTTTTEAPTTTTTTIPDAPVAGDDTRTTEFNTAVTDGITRDNDSGTAPLTTNLVTDTTNGTLVLATDGTYTYTPTPGFSGNDTFTYTVTDGYSQTSNTATVTITVRPFGAISISAGGEHTCAVMVDHTARCWGRNTYFGRYGQLGNNTTTNSSVPAKVVDPADTTTALGGIASISAGTGTTCAVMTDSTARCWGNNTNGALGNNTTTDSLVAATVVDPADTTQALSGIASITAGVTVTCALMTDSTARCWGNNTYGQLGNNTNTNSSVPVTVVDPADTTQALGGIASITSGANHACALMTDSTARCWGFNAYGQLGNNTNTDASVPVTVVDPADLTTALGGIASITAEAAATCALMTDHTARCWGRNNIGQLGNNTNTNSSVPVTVVDPADTTTALGGIASITTGGIHACAVMTDHTAPRCWGTNAYGQLGDGTNTGSNVPVTVSDWG
jgi:alpha-tubulin suppressor-like RCC1 family protein